MLLLTHFSSEKTNSKSHKRPQLKDAASSGKSSLLDMMGRGGGRRFGRGGGEGGRCVIKCVCLTVTASQDKYGLAVFQPADREYAAADGGGTMLLPKNTARENPSSILLKDFKL
ncbi:hypothetical protein ILYODFUR_011086 [Ilyodon furcidens]|uniref:Uncharacterized protein n=1 Tax=Ilyodon furcidens TaxID=33524 RepID=A0ABV0TJ19_9TELE